MVGITAAKTVLYSRIMLPVPGAGSMHFPRGHGYDARYFHQLTSEKRMTRYSHGRPYYIYEAGNRRNEPLDIRVYALAAHRRVNFDSVAIKAEMAKSVPVAVEPVAVVSESLTAEPERLASNIIVVERAPIERPAGLLPAYVPMSQRIKSGGSGDSMFKR
jgi:phage terminase large subunit GpA-like protein